jgi:hypothetical protein
MRSTTLTLLVLLLSGVAQAGEKASVLIASGESGGTYRSIYAKNFERQLHDYDVFHRKTTGSGENLELLISGKADAAFVQADIYAAHLRGAPERFENVVLVGRIATECVYIAYRSGGAVKSLDQLGQPVGDRRAKIAVGPELGGASGTWSLLATLDPALANTVVDHGGDILALNQLAVGAYDAMIWVTDPKNLKHKLLQAAHSNKALKLMPIENPKLVYTLPSGVKIYEPHTVALEEGWRGEELNTICTSALVLARKNGDPRFIQKLAEIVSKYTP